MPGLEDNLIRVTNNLDRRKQDLEAKKKAAGATAFANMYEAEFESFKDILKENATDAFKSTDEFQDDIFLDPLLRIIETNQVLVIIPINDFTAIRVDIDLETHAGNIEDYANGVKYARKVFEAERKEKKGKKKRKYRKDPARASAYWANVVYGKKDSGLYDRTMSLRFSKFEGLAPFWYLVNFGTPQPMSSEYGGYPTPTNDATGFVEKSIQEILERATPLYEQRRDEINEQIINDIADVDDIQNEITSAINRVNETPENYQTPQVLSSILYEGQQKYLYITQRGRIGLSAAPRFSGYRRLSTGGF